MNQFAFDSSKIKKFEIQFDEDFDNMILEFRTEFVNSSLLF